jgi:FkbM family methyltransferase
MRSTDSRIQSKREFPRGEEQTFRMDSIYDVGLHNGDDTAYYLQKGFKVLAIEANPLLVANAQRRFEREIIAGRLRLLPVGIAESEGTFSFWVNEENDTWSSFEKTLGCRNGTRCHELQIPCLPFSTILKEYGVPYYLKVDIEGKDYLCVASLKPGHLPKYISCELSHDEDIITRLHQVGYQRFKVLNQDSFTASTPIFENEIGWRVLRKACNKVHALKYLLHRLPSQLQPRKIDFDNFTAQFEFTFNEGCSGPFGEETYGLWYSFEDILKKVAKIRRQLVKAKFPLGNCWFDVHATW